MGARPLLVLQGLFPTLSSNCCYQALTSVWRKAAYNMRLQRIGAMPEPDIAEKDFLQRLRRDVERQISAYVYQLPAGALGTPLKPEEIRSGLDEMRRCLVEPRWEEVVICNTPEEIRTANGVSRKCVTMAEDEGYALVFDPLEKEYHLAWRSERGLGTWGIRGDAIGCFLAR